MRSRGATDTASQAVLDRSLLWCISDLRIARPIPTFRRCYGRADVHRVLCLLIAPCREKRAAAAALVLVSMFARALLFWKCFRCYACVDAYVVLVSSEVLSSPTCSSLPGSSAAAATPALTSSSARSLLLISAAQAALPPLRFPVVVPGHNSSEKKLQVGAGTEI